MDIREEGLENYRYDFKNYAEWLKDKRQRTHFIFYSNLVIVAILFGATYFFKNDSFTSLRLFDFLILGLMAMYIGLSIDFSNDLKDVQCVNMLKQEKQLDEIISFLRDIKYNTLSQEQKIANLNELFTDELKELLVKVAKTGE